MGVQANGPNLPVPCPVSPLDFFENLKPFGIVPTENCNPPEDANQSLDWAWKRLDRLLSPSKRNLEIKVGFHENSEYQFLVTSQGKSLTGLEARALIIALMASDSYYASPYRVLLDDYEAKNAIEDQKAGYVYLLHGVGTNFYKVGHTNNLDRRIKQISPILPFRLELIHSIKTDNRYALEAFFHNKFRASRQKGEWFELSPEEISLFCSRRSLTMSVLFELTDTAMQMQEHSELAPWHLTDFCIASSPNENFSCTPDDEEAWK